MKYLRLVEKKEIRKGFGYVFRTFDGRPVLSTSNFLEDSFEKQNKWKNGQYSSGHFLHKITTKDFLQIGIGGAGSANGIVIKPLTYLNYSVEVANV